MDAPRERFDYVIVGGGSAGCVLANRLSQDPAIRVALIEGGVDTPPDAVPVEILDSYPMPLFFGDRYIWPSLQARAVAGGRSKVYEQGRVMGGGSSINVQAANRGLPRDYDEWAASGAPGWSWQDVLPYFRNLERDVDYGNSPLHGSHGPVPIRRILPQAWPPFCTEFGTRWAAAAYPRWPIRTRSSAMAGFPPPSRTWMTSGFRPPSPISTRIRAGGPICGSMPRQRCASSSYPAGKRVG